MSEQTQPDPPTRRWLSIEEAGAILGVGRARAYELARQGVIPTFRISERRLLVPAKALDELEDAAIERAREIAVERLGSLNGHAVGDMPAPLQLTPRQARRRVKREARN
jgi:excisionase family DNA binding protein